jgi:hypothetical protein
MQFDPNEQLGETGLDFREVREAFRWMIPGYSDEFSRSNLVAFVERKDHMTVAVYGITARICDPFAHGGENAGS